MADRTETSDKSQFFNSTGFTPELLERIKKVVPRLYELIEKGIVINHRDLGDIIDCVENGREIYIYTGRGPSNTSLHFGHYLPFYLTKTLQDILDAKVVVQITDDEKYLYSKGGKKPLSLNDYQNMAINNIKDIISFGFDPDRTFIFTNTSFIGSMYETDLKIKRYFTLNQIVHAFGIGMSENVGKASYPTLQMVPCVPKVFDGFIDGKAKCLIPCADDQDVYFRLARDILKKMKVSKPSMIFVNYVPSLQSVEDKMSSSIPSTAIFLNDSNKVISKKINSAFSGGRETVEEHRELGADCAVDVPINILKYFIDREEFTDLWNKYFTGEHLTGFIKKRTVRRLIEVRDEIRERRKDVTDEVMMRFMTLKK